MITLIIANSALLSDGRGVIIFIINKHVVILYVLPRLVWNTFRQIYRFGDSFLDVNFCFITHVSSTVALVFSWMIIIITIFLVCFTLDQRRNS